MGRLSKLSHPNRRRHPGSPSLRRRCREAGTGLSIGGLIMTKLLANENVAADVVSALRADGHDGVWIKEVGRGSTNEVVLAMALAENRVLLTFDKDFGELAFRLGRPATPGVILLRLAYDPLNTWYVSRKPFSLKAIPGKVTSPSPRKAVSESSRFQTHRASTDQIHASRPIRHKLTVTKPRRRNSKDIMYFQMGDEGLEPPTSCV